MNETETGMIRESKDEKLNHLSYTTAHNLDRYGQHMKIGEIKHGRSNWKKGGYNREEWLESAQRHLLLLWEGDTSEDHASAVRFNMEGLMHQEYLEANSDNV